MRNFIIEKVQAEKNSNGRDTKEKRLYDYITGSMRSREMRKKIEKKMKLDGLQGTSFVYKSIDVVRCTANNLLPLMF